jgi:lysophospholipase L1-like esterase
MKRFLTRTAMLAGLAWSGACSSDAAPGVASGGGAGQATAGSSGSAAAGAGGSPGSSGSGSGAQAGAGFSGGAQAGATGIGGASAAAGSGGLTSIGGAPLENGGGGAGAVSGGAAGVAGDNGGMHWVGTWSASPYAVDSSNQPPASLTGSVLRQVVHVSLAGSQIRVQLSNLSGDGPVTINAAHVALCKATPAVDSTIDPATDHALAFAGSASVTIPAGKEVWSDPLAFSVPALGNVSITLALGQVPSTLTGHAGSRTTSYLKSASSSVNDASMSSAQKTDHWYYIAGLDVMAEASAKCAVVIGDSITDGRGTDTNKNNRWTDVLAARLQGNPETAHVALLNQGIGATNLVGATGTAAEARFNRDVLGQSGVRYAIVYDGVNDIGSDATFAALKAAYEQLIMQAHEKGLLIYAGTILPFGANSYFSAAHESVRQQVNAYLKSGVFDGYIDFDAALTDSGEPPKLQTMYATWAQADGLHPGPAGYQKMGDTPALSLFTK